MPSHPVMPPGLYEYHMMQDIMPIKKSRAYGKNRMRHGYWPINDGADTF